MFSLADGDRPVKSSSNHKKLGPAGLALHYANIVTQIDTLVSLWFHQTWYPFIFAIKDFGSVSQMSASEFFNVALTRVAVLKLLSNCCLLFFFFLAFLFVWANALMWSGVPIKFCASKYKGCFVPGAATKYQICFAL